PAHRSEVDARPIARGQRLEEGDALASELEQRLAGTEVDRLAAVVADGGDGTGLDAQLAAGAVLDVDLQRVARVGKSDGIERSGEERVRSAVQLLVVEVARANDAVRADEAAVAALDAEVGLPDSDKIGDVALLVRCGPAGVGAVHRERAHGQVVSSP